jgi:hypothetical protein
VPPEEPRDKPQRPQKAFWRRGVDSAERAVGGRVEPAVQRREFAVGLGLVKRLDVKVRGVVEGVTGRVLHAVNIPTARDVRRLHEHLNAVDAHLSEVVREREHESPEAGSRDRASGVGRSDSAQPRAHRSDGAAAHAKARVSKSSRSGGAPGGGRKPNTSKSRRSEPAPGDGSKPTKSKARRSSDGARADATEEDRADD